MATQVAQYHDKIKTQIVDVISELGTDPTGFDLFDAIGGSNIPDTTEYHASFVLRETMCTVWKALIDSDRVEVVSQISPDCSAEQSTVMTVEQAVEKLKSLFSHHDLDNIAQQLGRSDDASELAKNNILEWMKVVELSVQNFSFTKRRKRITQENNRARTENWCKIWLLLQFVRR